MAKPSQCLDDAPFRGFRGWEPSPSSQAYSEAQRLALEELIAGGRPALRAFLRREKVRSFLSEPEIQAVLQAVVPPPRALERSAAGDARLSNSLDGSSLAYFPEQDEAEPPALELGWPAFSSGSFRGPSQLEMHFQPSFGDRDPVYPCKEAVRKLIRSAKKVVAVVMDVFTDMDIFIDLLEACRMREVKVYVLLDQVLFPYFLKMSRDLGVDLQQEKFLSVRSITGKTFYTRSGAKLVGKAREKFILVDGIRVATGSYSFTWTDGQLSSSNIVILSGPAVEHFERRFRILYVQSKLANTKMSLPHKNTQFGQFFRNAKPSTELCRKNILRMDFFYLRAFAGNVKDKQTFLQVSRDTQYESNIVIKVPPPLKNRNNSVFIRAQKSIRW